MDFVGIIPARYASSRFPGKPLAIIGGKSMIQHVYEQAQKAMPLVAVATDDQRIAKEVASFGGKAIMTGDANTGTDRVAYACEQLGLTGAPEQTVVINIQGDEPFIAPEALKALMAAFENDPNTQIGTLARKAKTDHDIFDPNAPKVIFDHNNDAIYFSRSPIPYIRGLEPHQWLAQGKHFSHIGIYAFRLDILRQVTQLAQTSIELAESLEQNRWLQNAYRIKVVQTTFESIAVDTPEDLERAVAHWQKQ